MTAVRLVGADGSISAHEISEPPAFVRPTAPLRSREVVAAAHVVPVRWSDATPGSPAQLDWDATLAFRHHLWSWGLGVADAMDTAQRNAGLDARATRELISRSSAEARAVGGALVVGVNTDHLEDEVVPLGTVIDAYRRQLADAEDDGAGVVLMASRHLARAARSVDDYERVYAEVLDRASVPVILHWLGPAFDPVLAGYWGSADVATAADAVVRIIERNVEKVRGIKMSLLDADAEVALRERLPDGVRMLTGDDYHYVDLIAGDGSDRPGSYSDALLGALAAIAPAASAAVQALDAGDRVGFERILRPTEELARKVFAAPTWFYKTGIAFLAWLNGHQPGFVMVGGQQSARSLPHLSELVRLADGCGALEDPDLAARRWAALLEQYGVTEVGAAR